MKTCLTKWKRVVYVVISLSLIGCDSSPASRSKRLVTNDEFAQVRDLTHDDFARKAIAAQTEIESGRAPGACTALLLSEGKDVYVQESVTADDSHVLDAVCSLDDMQMANLLKESRHSNRTSNHNMSLLADTLTQHGKIKGDLRYNDSNVNEYSDDFAKQDALIIRKVYCAERSAESFKATASESFKSIVSPLTLEKFNACVRAKSYGLYCDASVSGDKVIMTVKWEPIDLVRDILPAVALDWGAASNFQATAELPKVLGIGSGYTVSFTKHDSRSGNVVGVSAHDRGRNFNFSCRLDLEKRKPFTPWVKTRRPECGVELAKSGEGIECGAKSYKRLRSAVCGVESFKVARSRACGVERYKSRHDCDLCGQSNLFGGCNKCAHVSFGVDEYRECSDLSHGVALYSECEHPTHGPETFYSCRHVNFGVELYRECEDTSER